MESLLTLLVLLSATFPSVVTHEISVFTLEGGSAMFDKVQRNLITKFDDIVFKLNPTHRIMKFLNIKNNIIIEDPYKDRLILNTTTFSLELRNLQKNDSGLYTYEIRWNFNISKVVYKLFVLEPVAAPALTLASNWSSSNSCDVTVTCRSHDLSLTFSCNRNSCTQLGNVTITPTLVVFARDGYIICNHSNQVSWRNVTLNMPSLCEFVREEDPTQWTVERLTLLTIGLICAGIAVACVGICICQKKRRSTGTDSSDYADIIWSNQTTEPQPVQPVIYSLLQPPMPDFDAH